MLDLFKKLFPQSPPEKTTLSEDEVHVTALALMLATARADNEIAESELSVICEAAARMWGQTESARSALIERAQTQEADATSLYEFTSVIHEHFDQQQKQELITAMWQVAFADGELDRYEEHIIRRVADLIYLEHSAFMQAKHLAAERQSGSQ